jgi:inner membrane protease subunit 1
MTPTIPSHYIGTYPIIAISKLQRRGRNIKVGDIVSFAHPMIPNARGAKRVIGMPGDFVCVMTPGKTDAEIEDHSIVGGEVKEEMFQVPEGHCWLAGDNLDWSRDGRIFGPVPLGLVKGKVVAVVWPPSAMSWIKNSLTNPSAEEAEWRIGG